MSSLSCGIVGLPNVGKSTLFNALMNKKLTLAANYPFCTIDPTEGTIPLKDKRLDVLSEISKAKKIIPAQVTFVDIAGIVKGASKGEGLGNQFLQSIRECDALIQMVRCFDDNDVIHVSGSVDPVADVVVINTELCLADMQTCEVAIKKLESRAKLDKDANKILDVIKRAYEHLQSDGGQPLRTLGLSVEELSLISSYNFFTLKKILYVANVASKDLPSMRNDYVDRLEQMVGKENVLPLCAQIEEELATEFEDETERLVMLKEMELTEPGLDRLARAAFKLLGLITYLTTGVQETRAWTIPEGTKAPQAAGKIHSDLERGFIRAEIVTYEDFVKYGSEAKARDAGVLRTEGKDYVMKDGDVVHFLSNT